MARRNQSRLLLRGNSNSRVRRNTTSVRRRSQSGHSACRNSVPEVLRKERASPQECLFKQPTFVAKRMEIRLATPQRNCSRGSLGNQRRNHSRNHLAWRKRLFKRQREDLVRSESFHWRRRCVASTGGARCLPNLIAAPRLMANPSIERTCPGKLGHASHVKLQGLPADCKQHPSWVYCAAMDPGIGVPGFQLRSNIRSIGQAVDVVMQRVRTAVLQTVIGAASAGSGP